MPYAIYHVVQYIPVRNKTCKALWRHPRPQSVIHITETQQQMETLLGFRRYVVKIKQMVDMVVFVYKMFSIHHWRPALLSLEPSNSSVWIDAAGIGYPKILSEFPAELEPSFQFTFTCFLQPASHLTIYFLLCCKTCSSYHDALILGQHIFRLGKNVQHVLSYFYPNPSSVLQRNPEVPIQPWLSKEFSAPRAKLPAAEISVFGNRSWNRGSD